MAPMVQTTCVAEQMASMLDVKGAGWMSSASYLFRRGQRPVETHGRADKKRQPPTWFCGPGMVLVHRTHAARKCANPEAASPCRARERRPCTPSAARVCAVGCPEGEACPRHWWGPIRCSAAQDIRMPRCRRWAVTTAVPGRSGTVWACRV